MQIGDLATPVEDDQKFTYDWSNRLVKAEAYASGVWSTQGEYQYDALNRRVSKQVGTSLTLFAYDGSRVAYELVGTTLNNATLTRSYAYNSYIDSPLLMIDEDGSSGVPAGYKYYYFQDRRFSVVALAATSTTGVGVVGERYRYTAFGQWTVHQASGGWLPSTSSASSFQNPYGYTGRRYDAETATATSPGLWHYRNRMYSSSLGRFLQRDPAGYIDGFNLYAYVRNNPLAFVDAFGLAPQRQGSSQFNSSATIGSGISPIIAGRFPNPAFLSSFAFGITTTDTQPTSSIGGIGTFAEFEQAITVDNVPVAEAIGRFAEELALHNRLGALGSGFLPRSESFMINTFVSSLGSADGFGNGELGVVNAFLSKKAGEPNAAEFFGFSNQLQPNAGFNGTHLSGIAISRKVPEPAMGLARILQQVNEDLSQLRNARLNKPGEIPEREAELRIDLIAIEFTLGVQSASQRPHDKEAIQRARRDIDEHLNENFNFMVRARIRSISEFGTQSIADRMVTDLLNTRSRREFLESFQLQRRLQEDGPLEIDQVIDRLRELVPEMDP